MPFYVKISERETFWNCREATNVDKSALCHIPSYSENLQESVCEEKKIIGNAYFLFSWTGQIKYVKRP